MRVISIPVLLIVLGLPLWSQNDLVRLKREYTITTEKLEPHTDGFALDDDKASVDLLERKWQVAAEWIATWLDAHPKATEKQVNSAFSSLDRDIGASILLLAPYTYVVAIARGEMGTVFVVGADASSTRPQYRVRWTIRDPQSAYEKELAAWTAPRAVGGCRVSYEGNCGPLAADSGRLPDTIDGHPRFYLDATYAQDAGTTVGKQVSIWEWD